MSTITLSRVIGYSARPILPTLSALAATDAYVAAFTLPDWLNYIVAGGTASITFISIYTRFLAENTSGCGKDLFHHHHRDDDRFGRGHSSG